MPSDRLRADSVRTRERLLDAAERLFAAHGIHAVSLRAINAAAGARNVSAVHYHFGSKDGVIAAVVARRMGALAEERLAALAAVERTAGGPPALRPVVEAMVLPFLRLLVDDPQGADYVTFLARVVGEADVALERLAPPAFWTMVARLEAVLRRALPDLPPRVRLLRIRFVFQQAFVLVTELQRLARGGAGRLAARDVEVMAHDFVDYLVGGLGAPSRAAPEGRRESDTPRRRRPTQGPRRIAAVRGRGPGSRARQKRP